MVMVYCYLWLSQQAEAPQKSSHEVNQPFANIRAKENTMAARADQCKPVVLNLFSTAPPFSNFPLFHAPDFKYVVKANVFLG